jgi:DNA repair and recombination protein RAD52
VAYIATVRVTHRKSGVFREDCGAGDSIDRSLAVASGNALKGAVTDAMKRAARHFGEKLGEQTTISCYLHFRGIYAPTYGG